MANHQTAHKAVSPSKIFNVIVKPYGSEKIVAEVWYKCNDLGLLNRRERLARGIEVNFDLRQKALSVEEALEQLLVETMRVIAEDDKK